MPFELRLVDQGKAAEGRLLDRKRAILKLVADKPAELAKGAITRTVGGHTETTLTAFDQLVAEGLLWNVGTDARPKYDLTDAGQALLTPETF